ncbi:MAG: plastocyanin/azurin family copper-binding protein, partial [Saprospiraceae bacterium]
EGGHSSTSDATSGPDSWNSGVIGIGSIFNVTLQNPGVHNYYCIPHGGPGGVGMSGNIVANCPGGNNFTVDITFNTTQANPGGYNVLIDNVVQPGSPHSYNGTGSQSVTATLSGDGQVHEIKIEDVDDPTCFVTTNFTAPDCGAAPTCSLSITAVENGPCTANDDVPVDVTVTAINPGNQGFNIKVDGVLTPGSPYTYAASGPTTVTVDVAGDGQPHDLQAIDVADPTCNATTTLTTTNCAIPCSLTNLTASTGSSATHVVTVNDNFFEPKHVIITTGDVVEWQWVGAISHSSTSDATSGPNSWDSGVIGPGSTFTSPVLAAGVHPYYCIPHGAPGGVGMSGTVTVQASCTNGEVGVTITFDEAGGGFNGFRVLVDGTPVDTLTYDTSGTNSVNINVVGDGQSHTILVEDVDDPACSASTSIVTPNCNFTPTCEMTLTVAESGCNAADSVDVELSVAAINGGSGFNLSIDGNAYGGNPVAYDSSGTTLVNLTFSGDSSSHVFIVQDVADSLCADTASVILPNCAAPCSMSNLTLSTGGTGNPVTHVIEVKDFEFVPKDITVTAGDVVHWEWVGVIAHTTTSDATSGPLTWDSGLFNNGATFDVTISETGFHPYYCIPHGAPGGIGMSGTIVANPPCDSGQVAVTLSFDASNGGASGYNVKVDGNIVAGSPFNYSASGTNTVTVQVSGDGNSHTITVIDTEDLACTISGTLTTPNCGGGNGNNNCELSVAATQTGDCDSQNQIPVELTITHSFTGISGFNVKVGPNLVPGSPFGYDTSGVTVLTIPVTGTGQSRTIIVEDVDSMTCTAQTQILTPLCGPTCEIQNIIVVASGKKHVVEVEDFEFIPANLDIVLGDTVEFIWTGANTHTTTSDTTSGPDSWNSGLLNNGDTFQVVISEAGDHPYYSIPDGGPGGIGMSGVIHALDTCDNGIAALNVSFEVSNGSPLGYRVFVDGEEVPDGPFQYNDPTGANNVVIQTPGDGVPHLVTVQDLDINFCAATASFTTP